MIIRKRPIVSWLLNHEDENKLEIPINNRIHFKYLFKGMEFLSDVRDTKPDWGLPELIMPSFEKVMKKSAKSFFNIDHQLFQEFYNDNVCGILIEEGATIIYGFEEDTLYVWLFKEEIGKSTLLLYFYIKSSTDNKRQIYKNLADKLIIYLAVKKYVQVEKVIIPLGTSTLIDDTIKDYRKKEKIKNESGQEVIVMDSRWFRKIVNDNDIFVRGFFRLQNKKNEMGEWYKELIFVDSFVRHGYHRNAIIEDKDNS